MRALVGLLVVVVCAVSLSLIGGANGGLEQKADQPDAVTYPCTWVQQVGVGVDLALPIIKTGAGDQCDMTNATAGQGLAVVAGFCRS